MRFAAAVALLGLGPMEGFAQSTTNFLVLHTFSDLKGDGAHPKAGLVLSGNTLYGTTTEGDNSVGTIFEVNTDSSGYHILYTFTNGTDGATPMAPLLVAGGMLYGTASAGGASNYGTVFSLATGGSNFSTLYYFTNGVDGAGPATGLVLSGNTLYGTTEGTLSGSSYGSVFMINTNGSGFGVLHNFSKPVSSDETNSEGFSPTGSLFMSGSTLYGVDHLGGTNGTGTLFTYNGSTFALICTFATEDYFFVPNSSGAEPLGGVVLSGTNLYGTTYEGGSDGYGAVYQVGVTGSGLSPIYSFTAGQDYLNPQGPLNVLGNMLYGSTPYSIFGLTTNGTGITTLFTFPGSSTNATGSSPNAGLILSPLLLSIQQAANAVVLTWTNPTFYGTAYSGGTDGYGTVFAFNFESFALQSAPALTGTFTNILGATSPYTNALTGSPMFFRLQAN
jgi:uncharacterized repeat protein (TIGR03803 family)